VFAFLSQTTSSKPKGVANRGLSNVSHQAPCKHFANRDQITVPSGSSSHPSAWRIRESASSSWPCASSIRWALSPRREPDFPDILWIMNEDMAAAVIRYLKNQGILDQYIVIAQNGSPVGIPLVNSGELNYTISSSPGWEGMVALLALFQYVSGDSKTINQQIMLPVIPVTKGAVLDKRGWFLGSTILSGSS